MVFVLDQKKRPLMPCTPKRARLLLARGRAVIHRVQPFVIRLKDRRVEDCVLQPIALKIDPGSKTTGMALARVEATEEGKVHRALFLCEVGHRGHKVHDQKVKQANARSRRRSANLRHRAPRFDNRKVPEGWLPPSILSRVGNVVTWSARLSKWAPVSRIEVERVRFDTQLLQNPEIAGTQYQRGTLAGWEARAYLLVKYAYRCAYCSKADTPFEVDHILPRSRGGSNRISNLCLACHACNQEKGDKTAAEFGHPEVEAQAKRPLKDAAAVNATRFKVVEALPVFGLPISTWTGGRTKWNRAQFAVEKTHALDALCVGDLAGVRPGKLKTLSIKASGRGDHCRTNWTKHGFPRGYKMRQKQVHRVKTGDRVRAVVKASLKTAGIHVGRVQVRTSGFFDIQTHEKEVEGVNAKYCPWFRERMDMITRSRSAERAGSLSSPATSKERLLPPNGSKPGASAGGGFGDE
jgi:5-methylcytosine-specific restriction endonuclease McrA